MLHLNSIEHLLFDLLPFQAFLTMKQAAAGTVRGQADHHGTQRRNKSPCRRSFTVITGFISRTVAASTSVRPAGEGWGWTVTVTSPHRPTPVSSIKRGQSTHLVVFLGHRLLITYNFKTSGTISKKKEIFFKTGPLKGSDHQRDKQLLLQLANPITYGSSFPSFF